MSNKSFAILQAGAVPRYKTPFEIKEGSGENLPPEERERLLREFERVLSDRNDAPKKSGDSQYDLTLVSPSDSMSNSINTPQVGTPGILPQGSSYESSPAFTPLSLTSTSGNNRYLSKSLVPLPSEGYVNSLTPSSDTPLIIEETKNNDDNSDILKLSQESTYSMQIVSSQSDSEPTNAPSEPEILPIGKRWEKAVKDMIVMSMKGDRFSKEKNEAMEKIFNITREFNDTATTYMRTIISEKLKPVANRTINTKELKGYAGGLKLVVGNEYFFKLPDKNLEEKLQYPSYDASAKVAGHEIKACTHFFNTITNPGIYKSVPGLVPDDPNTARDEDFAALRKRIIVPPLMVLIDYLGNRAIAMCKFDFDNNTTLIAGSGDGGKNVMNKLDPETKQILSLVNKYLLYIIIIVVYIIIIYKYQLNIDCKKIKFKEA